MKAAAPSPETDRDALKRAAAEAAVQLVENDMVVGLGSGSTAAFAVEAWWRGNWNYRPKLVTHSSIILARSKGRIAWLQRKVLVAIGAVAATIPIVAFQQAPVSRQSRVPRVGHVREQP